ncbi:MAG: hypothetical protein RL594_8 [Bacteroidota bacterium]|jgi:hypothetical protein
MTCVFVFIVSLLCMLPHRATAQARNYVYYSTQNGLPSNVIYDIQQDRTGFVWIATDQGVSRFDGRNFVNFSSRDGLNDNDVFKICEDRDGRIWFFTFKSDPCYYYRGKIYNRSNDRRINLADDNSILTFSVDAMEKSILFIDGSQPNGSRLVDIDTPGRYIELGELAAPNVIFSHFTIGKDLFLMRREGADAIYLVRGHQLVPVTSDERLRGQRCLLEQHQMVVYNRAKNRIYRVDLRNQRFAVTDSFDLQHSYKTITVHHGMLYGLHERLGFVRLESGKEYVLEKSLMHGTILGGLLDRNGNTWYYSSGSGLSMFPNNPYVFYNTQTCPSIPENRCLSIARLQGKMLVGFENAGVHAFQGGTFRNVDVSRDHGKKSRILKMITHGNSVLAGGDEILVRINADRTSERIHVFDKHAVKDIEARGSHVVLAAHASYLSTTDNFTTVLQSQPTRYTSVSILRNGDVLLGKLKGLSIVHKGGNAKEPIPIQVHPLLDGARISDIKQDSNGLIWIGTHSNGLFVTNLTTTRHLDVFSGSNNTNYIAGTICKDLYIYNGSTWLATNKGINRIAVVDFAKGQFNITRYTRGTGLPSEDVNAVTVFDDTVYAATSNGLVSFNQKDIKPIAPPVIVLNNLYVNLKDTTLPDRASLESESNNISFALSGISYTGGEPVTFKVRLVGLQDEWTYTQNDRIEFVALKPGIYRFEAEAIGSDYQTSSNKISYTFTIRRPFYTTTQFYSAVLLSLSLASVFLVRKRIARAREKATANSQIMELKLQALRAQMNPHFIFNALTSIQYFFAIHEERQANMYMSSFASLIRQTLNSTRRNFNTLREEFDILQKYIALETLRLETPTDFIVDIDEAIDQDHVLIPSMLLQPLVENALLHGVRQTASERGRLVISCQQVAGHIHLTIQDNGPGLTDGKKRAQSAGLDITRQRIDTMNQMYQLELEMSIQNVSSVIDSDTGTRVIITMKTTTSA